MVALNIYDAPTGEEATNLQAMRDWINQIQHPNETVTTVGKLDLIQRLLIDHTVTEADVWKLSALGITFGDALEQAMQGRLKWVMVEGSAGISPALRWKRSDVLIYPISAIRERIQAGEAVDIHQLYAEYVKVLPFHAR